MKTIFALLLLFIHVSVFSQDDGIAFKETTFDEAIHAAKQAEKPLFLYVYGPACHFCKIMEKNVFPDKEVSEYYNQTFVDYKVNLDEEQGKILSKQFHISGTPTYLFFDKDGSLIHISGAEKKSQEFIQDGKNALDSTKAYVALKEKYNRGDRSPDFLYNFSNMLLTVSDSPDVRNDVEEAYLKTQDNEALSSKKNLEYIFNHATTINAPATKYYFDVQKPLSGLLGGETIKQQNTIIIGNAANEAGYKNNGDQLRQVKSMLRNVDKNDLNQLSLLADVKYSMGSFQKDNQRWKPYADAAFLYGSRYASKDYTKVLYEAATYLFYFTNSKESLQKGVQIINVAIAANNTYYNLFTKARLLHKLGQPKTALATAQSAIKTATPNDDTQDAKDLIEEIKKSGEK
ncbi:MAG: thioredoxin family protein [Agriterribacter sp.]